MEINVILIFGEYFYLWKINFSLSYFIYVHEKENRSSSNGSPDRLIVNLNGFSWQKRSNFIVGVKT